MPIQQKNVLPVLLVGLPLGLLVLGIGSMIYTELLDSTPAGHAEDEARERTREFAQLLRKPVSGDDLRRYVTLLSEDIGERNMQKPGALESAALLLESSMGPSNMGYEIRRQVYETDAGEVRNIIAELPGRSKREEIVVIGAHYDSAIGTPGADDNATGVAALLSLANAFVATENARTLRFVGFVNEEPPHFRTKDMGSLVYAADCKAREENVVAMIALESLGYFSEEEGSQRHPEEVGEGYPGVGNFVAFVGNVSSADLVNDAHSAFSAASGFPAEKGAFPAFVDGVGWSDHWSFWENGYPAIMVTDTATFRNPHYHTPGDTVETIDFEKFEKVASGLTAVVESLVNPQ